MAYNRKDFYFQKAKKENFAARSIFKLEEMDNRFKIIQSGDQILDLGAAPGSWSQYASKKTGPRGRLLGIDLQPVKLTLPNAIFLVGDLREIQLDETLIEKGFSNLFDVVLSDMAPRTTGIRITDQARSMELCEIALGVAFKFLKRGGSFVCKNFHNEEFDSFKKKIQARFEQVEVLRPKSTRKESKEIFFVGRRFKG